MTLISLIREIFMRLRYIILMSAIVVLSACSQQPSLTDVPPATLPDKDRVKESDLTATPQSDGADSPAIGSYHAVLLFERAADLMIALIENIQAGKISQGDSSATSPYANAFIVAAEAINQANPPGELSNVWEQIYLAAQQYNQAYIMLLQGIPISAQNLEKLKDTRKILTMDQEMVENYLIQSGVKSDNFDNHREMVDLLLQERYGNQPVPAIEAQSPTSQP